MAYLLKFTTPFGIPVGVLKAGRSFSPSLMAFTRNTCKGSSTGIVNGSGWARSCRQRGPGAAGWGMGGRLGFQPCLTVPLLGASQQSAAALCAKPGKGPFPLDTVNLPIVPILQTGRSREGEQLNC